MTYQLNGDDLLFAINRTDIVDINEGDVIAVDGFTGVNYIWTNHDREFLENNPDDDIYLRVQRVDNNAFKAKGILLK